MKKFMLGLLLVVAMVMVVSCSQDSLAQDNLVSIRFSKLEARAVDDIYSVSGDATWESASVQIGKVEDYYWTYCATKWDDSSFTTGETDDYVVWSEEKGLGGSKTFSAGKWYFELKAYASKEDRENRGNEDKAIFRGSVITGKLTTNQTVSVPMAYTYVSGEGAFDFTISTTITSPEGENYAITKVEMVIGSESVKLTEDDEAWTGSKSGIASGKQDIVIKVYVDDEATARVSKKIGTAYVLHGMTTNVTGSATISITEKTVELGFSTTLPSSLPADIAVGDTVTYGKLPSSETDITWEVLEVKEDRILVISEKVLFNMQHSTEAGMKSWNDSLIKAYLNKEGDEGFVSQYGLDDVEIVAAAEDESGYGAGNVFLLTNWEASDYYYDDGIPAAENLQGESGVYWWTRTSRSGESGDFDAFYSDGWWKDGGELSNNNYGVRPAFWISTQLFPKIGTKKAEH